MKITAQLTDDAILQEFGSRLAKARLDRNMTQAELAGRAGVSKRTIERLEAGSATTQVSTILRLGRVLEFIERFDALIPEAGPSPITLLKLRGKERKRASGAKAPNHVVGESAGNWTWGPKA